MTAPDDGVGVVGTAVTLASQSTVESCEDQPHVAGSVPHSSNVAIGLGK